MKQFLKISLFLFVLAFALMPRISFAAYVSDICKSGPTANCEESEVGPFMKGVSVTCGNTGRCTLGDLMTVVEDVGNFVLRIIGGLLLLFYVYGGFWYLVSHGDKALVDKGKKAIQTSTYGFLIIMFAWLGIHALYTAFTTKDVPNYVFCKDASTDNKACAEGKKCSGTTCK